MAGPGQKIAALMCCTVIRPSDMADNILDRKKHPQWQGERTKMVYSFPTNEKHWARYAEMRAESFRNDGDGHEASEFYRQNREEMDEGAVVAWPERHNDDELSAIQHAMNLKFRDEAAFFAEYQNEPVLEEMGDGDLLTAEQVAEKTNRLQRCVVPIGCSHLTMFVDVQANLLFFVVAAWEDDFTGYVIDYGSYPDQRRPYFTLRDARATLALAAPGTGLEGSIYAGLEKLTGDYLSRDWQRDDGAAMRIAQCLVDANWGQSTDVVYQFCRQSQHSAIVMPSHGRFVGASSIPFSEYARKPGDRVGHNWRIPVLHDRRVIRHVVYDTNYWKSFVYSRLAVSIGDRGCLSLFGDGPQQHCLFAEHITAEYRVKTAGRGRTVDEWKVRPGNPENHWFDCLVGSAVGASMLGVTLPGTTPSAIQRVRRKFNMASYGCA
jgi:phage terminase large subunit GpA-like protein